MPGRVEVLAISDGAGHAMQLRDSVTAIAGQGIEGDRYALGAGFYSGGRRPTNEQELTLIEAEVLEALEHDFAIRLATGEHRRNATTRGIPLNDLLGRQFIIGEALCEGVDLCEPCEHLVALTGKAVLEPLVHRGGLRARILRSGAIHVGDEIAETSAE